MPTESYTPWITRVLAAFIDWAPYVVLVGIGWVIMLVTQTSSCVTSISEYDVGQFCVSQPSMIGQLVQWLLSVGGLAYLVWNYGYRQGTIGSSIGKSVLKFKVVSETTGQPIGFGMSVVRQLAHFIDAIICFVGFLFPLWDAKRQTLADKIMTTVARRSGAAFGRYRRHCRPARRSRTGPGLTTASRRESTPKPPVWGLLRLLAGT